MPGLVREEVRRSPRLLVRVPVRVVGQDGSWVATTAVISLHGALLLSHRSLGLDRELELQNLKTGTSCKAVVVWDGGQDNFGFWKLGIEFAQERPSFWGSDYSPDPALP